MFLFREKLVLESNGKMGEKSDLSEAVLPSCLEKGENFGWLLALKFFKMLFAQMKS